MRHQTLKNQVGYPALRLLSLGYPSLLSCCLHPFSISKALVILLLLTAEICVADDDNCPTVCTCVQQTEVAVATDAGLVASCEDAGLLDIFTQLDSDLTRELLLNDVKGFAKLGKSRMIDLQTVHLQKLRITNSGIKEIQNDAFFHLSNLRELDLSQNQIGRLEPQALAGVDGLVSLNFSLNQLSDMGRTLTKLENLITLDLSANSLKGIPEGMFANLSSLTHLKLDGTPVRKLYARSFYGLSSLKELSLRDCAITNLDGEMFAFLPHLVTLNLGYNRLQRLPPAVALSGHKFLHTIYYDHNRIAELQADSFSGLSLDTVDLSHNNIQELGPKSFAGASLNHLDLSHNMLMTMSAVSLTPLGKQLLNLSLAKNPLRILPVSVFSSLEALTMLNLSACHLESLPHDAIKDLVSLKQLDLSHNKIHFLSWGTLKLLDKVELLELSGNYWVCDCSIHALKDWLGEPGNAARLSCQAPAIGKGVKCVEDITCAAPAGLLGQQVVKLTEEELPMCEEEDESTVPASTQGAIVASCMGFAIVLLIITIYLWRRGKTAHGLKRACVPSDAESSHKEDDEDEKVPPLKDCRRSSLTNSDHNFVFRHYFDHLVTDPKLMSDDAEDLEEAGDGDNEAAPLSKKERDSQYSSQNSVYSVRNDAAYGMESTV